MNVYITWSIHIVDMPEWSKGAVLRTAVEIRVGSNPTVDIPRRKNIKILNMLLIT